jgi:glycosyltransferase involved in cell wall biosynthesis
MKAEPVPDISAIVVAHHEGRLVHHTMGGVWRAVERARERGISCEVLAILDRPDDATRRYFAQHQPHVRIHQVDFGDTGPTRNFGIQQARGRYINFLDGDDIYCGDWLRRAFAVAEASDVPIVCHFEYTVGFGARHETWRHLSTTHPNFRYEDILEIGMWNPNCLVPRQIFLDHPFKECKRGSGFGFEDWHWFCEVLADGIDIQTVDETCIFYRRRDGSRFVTQSSEHNLKHESRLFDWPVLKERIAAQAVRCPRIETPQRTIAGPRQTKGLKYRIKQACWPPIKNVVKPLLPERLRDAIRVLRAPRTQTRIQKDDIANAPLPSWLREEWKALHAVEPLLFPRAQILGSMLQHDDHERQPSDLGVAYVDLCRRLPNSFSHAILVPWLCRGGSDLETLHIVRALVEGHMANGVAVFATEAVDSTWTDRLPAGVPFIDFGKLYGGLSEQNQRMLLAHFFIQKRPKVVHTLNSPLGHELFIRHGAALTSFANLYAHFFCDSLSADGEYQGYGRFYLSRSIDHVTAVISDNHATVDELFRICAFDPAKKIVHYQPVDRPARRRAPRPANDHSRPLFNVLWAGRIDFQKRPDILAAIAKRCKGQPFRFHVYGTSLLDRGRCQTPTGSNIVYHGGYDGFETLPLDQFDAFLYTSHFDGLPNVLLEAMAAGLPVIASDVCGVGELIKTGETGFLISPFEDAQRYVQALCEIAFGRADVGRLVTNAYDLLERRHSWAGFLDEVRAVPGYAVPYAAPRRRVA